MTALPEDASQAQVSADPAPSTTRASSLVPLTISDAPIEIPEGGVAAWLAVFASSLVCFFVVGGSYSWGVVQSRLVEEQVGTPAALAWVGSLWPACMGGLAIISSAALRVYGARKVGMLGSTVTAVGLLLSSFTAHSVPGLIVTSGLICGVGSALCFMMFSAVPSQFFRRRRGLANGIVYAGGGLGGGIIALASGSLIETLGVANMYRVFGSVMLACCLPATYAIRERDPPKSRQLIDVQLVRDLRFILIAAGSALAIFPLFIPPFFLPLYGESLGLASSTNTGLVAAFNFSSACGRLGFGFLSDFIGPLNALCAGLILNAVSLLVIWPISTSFAPLVVFAIVSGGANGSFFAAMPTVVGGIFGSERVSTVMGMTCTGWTAGYLTGAPIAGYLLEAFGGQGGGLEAFRPAMYLSGSLTLASVGLLATVRLQVHRKLLMRV